MDSARTFRLQDREAAPFPELINRYLCPLHRPRCSISNLHHETVLHEINHRWRGSATATSSPIVQHNLIAICEGSRSGTQSKRTTPNPHARIVHQVERTLALVLLTQEHL